MKLRELIAVLDTAAPPPSRADREVTSLTQDSRTAGPGSVFVALRGAHADGHRFIEQALRHGAVAAVGEAGRVEAGEAVITVPDSRRALARLAAAFYGHPSRALSLVGITGTNGKTTTSYLARSVIEASGARTGLIGTIDYRIGDAVYPAPNTTPESLELQGLLAEMVRRGASHCVMEVSSHALELGRTDECRFAVGAFTNLTQDHLDFHKTMDAYFRAKLLLFRGLGPDASAVVNGDDPREREIRESTKARIITFGLTEAADVRPRGPVERRLAGLAFTAQTPLGRIEIESPLLGAHNVYNILTATGIGIALGCGPDVIAAGISRMRAVPGRMEKIEEGQPFGVIVDYAHTEDALVRLLEAVREVAAGGRIITVFGCGGDRDRTKRPKMGAAAARLSDVVFVTSDNPRTEDPLAIIAEIESGITAVAGIGRHLVLPDRAAAIEQAVAMARPGDVVVLAGKGHEDYQIIGETRHRFDDREAARTAIRKARAA